MAGGLEDESCLGGLFVGNKGERELNFHHLSSGLKTLAASGELLEWHLLKGEIIYFVTTCLLNHKKPHPSNLSESILTDPYRDTHSASC